ncbi:MAG: lysophospholipase [Treponema sp.]|jgi:alpha-beta hydrolase superfamily lysophospholipase|nr:lysophospholipase [Treponema sp.]
MVQDESYFESHDGTKLYLYRWSPEDKPKAVLHIVHGMAEHALRYRRLAEKLTHEGIEVWAADMRGHGKTANPDVNSKGSGGLLGHCADGNGLICVTADIHTINKEIRKTKPDARLFLLGHSWGSFLVQNYIEYSEPQRNNGSSFGNIKIDGCILSGTKGPGDFMVKAGVPLMTVLTFFRGQRNGSNFARSLADGSYNKPFKPNRTAFDWISRDEEEVDKYAADPLCGFLCSTGFYRDLTRLLYNIHRSDAMARIIRSLPVYVCSGSADPVGDMGKSPTALVDIYRNLGIGDCEFVLYPGARHEILNETNRDEVTGNLLSWIKKHCE